MSDKQDLGIGKLIPEGKAAFKDAIHIPILPMIAGSDRLRPGEHVKIVEGTTSEVIEVPDAVYGNRGGPAIGIIDPFLTLPDGQWSLKKGDRVYVFVYPGTISGLRHEWDHPVFANAHRKTVLMPESERWLRQFADRWNFDYEELIANATGTDSEFGWRGIVAMGRDLHYASELGEDHDLFWQHIENMTGKKFDAEHREGMGWSCSC